MNNGHVNASAFQENQSNLFLSEQYQEKMTIILIHGEIKKMSIKYLMDYFLSSGASVIT